MMFGFTGSIVIDPTASEHCVSVSGVHESPPSADLQMPPCAPPAYTMLVCVGMDGDRGDATGRRAAVDRRRSDRSPRRGEADLRRGHRRARRQTEARFDVEMRAHQRAGRTRSERILAAATSGIPDVAPRGLLPRCALARAPRASGAKQRERARARSAQRDTLRIARSSSVVHRDARTRRRRAASAALRRRCALPSGSRRECACRRRWT